MSSTTISSRPRRRSLWAAPSSLSTPSLALEDNKPSRTSRRFSTLREPLQRPSSSSSRSSIYDSNSRSRSFSRGSRLLEDTVTSESDKRMSFIDFGERSPGGFLGSLKERMNRKKSAPLLRNSLLVPTPPSDEDSWMFRSTPPRKASRRSRLSTVMDDTVKAIDVDVHPALSFREERKLTVMPEEIVDGTGYGIREARKASVTESELGEGVDLSTAAYLPLPLRSKDCMFLHSYPHSEAPYMQNYNKVALYNDLYFHLLLRRLNPTGSPSFRDYPYPPQDVLDLGCGQGTWAQEAAAAWAESGTRIVGYDLVDLVSDIARPPPNTTWRRGNFVAYRLPFKSGSFNLVRLSNLTEAVPQSRWEHVLIEVRRVLRPNGRVEIIDDEMIFPYLERVPKPSDSRMTSDSGSHKSHASWGSDLWKPSDETDEARPSEAEESSFLDLDAVGDRSSVGSAPGLCRDDSPSEESSDCPPTPTGVVSVHGLETSLDSDDPTTPRSNPVTPNSLCREVESIYHTMVEGVYRVDCRPGDFLEFLLRKIFGPSGKARTMQDFQLSLLDSSMHDLLVKTRHVDSMQDRRSKKLFKSDRDGKRFDRNKEILDRVAVSQSKSKALRVLGADGPTTPTYDPVSTNVSDEGDFDDEPSVVRRPSMRPRAPSGIQVYAFPNSSPRPSSSSSAISEAKSRQWPTGLFIFPDQFLETTPSELERYLFKHIDVLLSSKAALDDFVLNLRDENGNSIIEEDEWYDILWEYERSRRERFNLPDAGGQFDDGDDEECDVSTLLKEPPRHPRTIIPAVAAVINNQSRLHKKASENPTLVRRIRVFEAYKIKPSLPA
ncbi:uncharacterized protein FOMMEDRAFT_19108 [Fomitiporia mediterranea MF3/22]|uniref:uncharacterized protein n=1 Tax=Fomitiporia mediterranea (strain MF3/22) TaxID=694068 RepID=UPI0004409606|nr:uncharacterized protein FOMMEDRAFT_19108 [Fomitiporia mediterranea MF3/22]EJD03744.1 hypothetical protein FOMMEDRAFT_19108 [Fomitiporia mediterranea MF3/22]